MPDADPYLGNLYILDPDLVPAVNCGAMDAHDLNVLIADREDFRRNIKSICVGYIDLTAHAISTNIYDRFGTDWYDFPEDLQSAEFILKLGIWAYTSGEDFEEVFGRLEALRKVVVKSTKKARESEDFRAFDEGVGKDYGVNFEDWNR